MHLTCHHQQIYPDKSNHAPPSTFHLFLFFFVCQVDECKHFKGVYNSLSPSKFFLTYKGFVLDCNYPFLLDPVIIFIQQLYIDIFFFLSHNISHLLDELVKTIVQGYYYYYYSLQWLCQMILFLFFFLTSFNFYIFCLQLYKMNTKHNKRTKKTYINTKKE